MSTAARIRSAALDGTLGRIVEIEASISNGLPSTVLVGLPDASVAQSRDRCRAAVVNSGQLWPNARVVINLAPSSLPKTGSHYDLGIALATMAAHGVIPLESLHGVLAIGELALDGRLRPVVGVLPATHAAQMAGCSKAMVPIANAKEAALVDDMEIIGVSCLGHAIAALRGEDFVEIEPIVDLGPEDGMDLSIGVPPPGELSEVHGQSEAKLAMIIAAAGGHHVSLIGPPGVGKTMLATRVPSLLPDLTRAEALEVSAIHSVAGTLKPSMPLLTRPPFMDPHHTATAASIVGGGSKVIRPGAMSLAHRGILFMDEAPEFAANVIDALRQPLEAGRVVVSRAAQTVMYPARFQLVLASNPCPCGSHDDCQCSLPIRRKYRNRISGPIRDRIDIHRELVKPSRLAPPKARVTVNFHEKVRAARSRQTHRFQLPTPALNSAVDSLTFTRACPSDEVIHRHLENQVRNQVVSPRGAHRVLRLAWTVADLLAKPRPDIDDINLALALRKSTTLASELVDWVAP